MSRRKRYGSTIIGAGTACPSNLLFNRKTSCGDRLSPPLFLRLLESGIACMAWGIFLSPTIGTLLLFKPDRHQLFGCPEENRSFGDRGGGEALAAEFVGGQELELIRGFEDEDITLFPAEVEFAAGGDR